MNWFLEENKCIFGWKLWYNDDKTLNVYYLGRSVLQRKLNEQQMVIKTY